MADTNGDDDITFTAEDSALISAFVERIKATNLSVSHADALSEILTSGENGMSLHEIHAIRAAILRFSHDCKKANNELLSSNMHNVLTASKLITSLVGTAQTAKSHETVSALDDPTRASLQSAVMRSKKTMTTHLSSVSEREKTWRRTLEYCKRNGQKTMIVVEDDMADMVDLMEKFVSEYDMEVFRTATVEEIPDIPKSIFWIPPSQRSFSK
jgi:hypothetical protein